MLPERLVAFERLASGRWLGESLQFQAVVRADGSQPAPADRPIRRSKRLASKLPVVSKISPTTSATSMPPIEPAVPPMPTTDPSARLGNISEASVKRFADQPSCAAAANETRATASQRFLPRRAVGDPPPDDPGKPKPSQWRHKDHSQPYRKVIHGTIKGVSRVPTFFSGVEDSCGQHPLLFWETISRRS